jgi:hypothetical protein
MLGLLLDFSSGLSFALIHTLLPPNSIQSVVAEFSVAWWEYFVKKKLGDSTRSPCSMSGSALQNRFFDTEV